MILQSRRTLTIKEMKILKDEGEIFMFYRFTCDKCGAKIDIESKRKPKEPVICECGGEASFFKDFETGKDADNYKTFEERVREQKIEKKAKETSSRIFSRKKRELLLRIKAYARNPNDQTKKELKDVVFPYLLKQITFNRFYRFEPVKELTSKGNFTDQKKEFVTDMFLELCLWIRGERLPQFDVVKLKDFRGLRDEEIFREFFNRYLSSCVYDRKKLNESRIEETSLDTYNTGVYDDDGNPIKLEEMLTIDALEVFFFQVVPINQSPEEILQGRETREELYLFSEDDIHREAVRRAEKETIIKIRTMKKQYPGMWDWLLVQPLDSEIWNMFAFTSVKEFMTMIEYYARTQIHPPEPFPSREELRKIYLLHLFHRRRTILKKKRVRGDKIVVKPAEINLNDVAKAIGMYPQRVKAYYDKFEESQQTTPWIMWPEVIEHDVEICFQKYSILEVCNTPPRVNKDIEVQEKLINLLYAVEFTMLRNAEVKYIDRLKTGERRKFLKGDAQIGKLEPINEKLESRYDWRISQLPRTNWRENVEAIFVRYRNEERKWRNHENWRKKRETEDKRKRKQGLKKLKYE